MYRKLLAMHNYYSLILKWTIFNKNQFLTVLQYFDLYLYLMTKKESMAKGDENTAWKAKPFIISKPSNRLPVKTKQLVHENWIWCNISYTLNELIYVYHRFVTFYIYRRSVLWIISKTFVKLLYTYSLKMSIFFLYEWSFKIE